MEMFTGELALVKEVEVILVDSDSDKFRTAMKYQLAGLVVQTRVFNAFQLLRRIIDIGGEGLHGGGQGPIQGNGQLTSEH